MDFEFSNKEELYKRVVPALKAKKAFLERDGYTYINEIDVWNYLIQDKWVRSHNLMLCDIVDDILNVDNKEIDAYLKKKLANASRVQYFDKDLDVLWGEKHEKEK